MIQGMTGSSSTGTYAPSSGSFPSTPASSESGLVCGLSVGMQSDEWYDDDGEGNFLDHDWPPPSEGEWFSMAEQYDWECDPHSTRSGPGWSDGWSEPTGWFGEENKIQLSSREHAIFGSEEGWRTYISA